MTRTVHARVAGFAFLFYIALGIAAMALFGAASRGEGIPERLAAIAGNEAQVRLAALLNLACGFAALTLGVSLYAITRDQDRDVAMLGLVCRAAEGVVGGISIQGSLGLLWIVDQLGPGGIDRDAAHALGAYLLGESWSFLAAATFFAVGSTCFSWLMLRGRMIPVALAWLGMIASVLLVVALPIRLMGLLSGTAGQLVWIPMAVFEVVLAVWFITQGVVPPRTQTTPARSHG